MAVCVRDIKKQQNCIHVNSSSSSGGSGISTTNNKFMHNLMHICVPLSANDKSINYCFSLIALK